MRPEQRVAEAPSSVKLMRGQTTPDERDDDEEAEAADRDGGMKHA